ncbi:acylphosphatase [Ectothiorhodospira lacustris]|uniref:acylphosphatase n=1 Tax=Ectothiorhodospira lacustris TaxID=2899127 RepID=UPI001EE8FF6C|nr:acylphosphatase [Ectothiorhodospira lacustris]MCG5508932.1 acylphosphatase [Ectothiorhodospira lacustris]MCG5520723.1 acylphosphatase [Ectothiorhodospira lacustris]
MSVKPHVEESCRCRVSGRVQGVYFRASTQRQAVSLGLRGHALNLPDGRVEVVVAGPADQVERLKAWLHEGPPQARVDQVSCEPFPGVVAEGFVIG